MKQIACAQMGGPETCHVMLSGNTPEELVQHAMDHVNEAHPEMAEQIKKMTPEDTTKWMEEFKVKFEAAPEV